MTERRWFGAQFRDWFSRKNYLSDNSRTLSDVAIPVFDEERNTIAAVSGEEIVNAAQEQTNTDLADVITKNEQQDQRLDTLENAPATNPQELTDLQTIVGTRASITYYYFASATASALSSANANTQAVWTWLTRFSTSVKNLADRFTAARIGTPADAANADTDASLWAQFKQSLATPAGVTEDAFNALSGLVGGRPSLTYYYFASATASALSSANANTQAVWTWLTRFSTSVKNLADRFTAARIGLPANAADDDTTASLWAQFKNALAVINNILGGQIGHTAVNVNNINLRVIDQRLGNTSTPSAEDSTKAWGRIRWLGTTIGNKLNTATWTAARVGLPADAADADTDASLWAQFKQSLANAGSGGGISQTAFDNLSNLVGTRASITYYYFASATASALSSANANTQSVWTWLTRFSNSIKNLTDKFTAARIGTPSGNLSYYADQNTSSISSASANSQDIWEWLTRFSFSIRNLKNRKLDISTWTAARVGDPGDAADSATDASLWAQFKQSLTNTGGGGGISQATFDALSNLVGTRASITYYYFASFTATALSSANANTQSVWTWITRLSNSIKNLGDRLATLTSQVGDKLDTSTWTAARVGNPGDTASAATTASLWAQFKQSLTNAGSGGGISQTTFDALANAVGLIGDTAAITSTRLWAQFNQVKAWLGSPSGNLSYYADQDTSSISSASAGSQSVWTWLTRFSFSIRNLKNRKLDTSTFTDARVGNPGDAADSATTASLWAQVKNLIANPGSGGGGGGVSQATFQALANAVGAVADAANIAGDTLWGQFNQIKEWVGVRPSSVLGISTTSLEANGNIRITSVSPSGSGVWEFLNNVTGRQLRKIRDAFTLVINRLDTLEAQTGSPDTSSERPAQYTEKINIQDKDTTLPNESGVETALADLGYQENDLVRNPVPKLYRVRGSHLPLDHPMRVTSTDTDIAISNSYHLYGWAKAVIPELTNATSGTIAEVDNAATQDIGDQLVAILNMSSLSTIDGKFIIVMSRPSASNDGFVPDELTIKIGDTPKKVFANVDEYHRTDTHIFYQTSQAFESGLGINPLFGDSQEGQAVNFDVGIKNAEGNNFLLSAATTLYLQEILIDRVSTSTFGKLVDIPAAQDKAIGSRYDTDDGETYIVKEKTGREKYVIPAPVGNGIYGQTNKSRGALSGTKNIEECAYDFANEHWRISFDDAASIQAATQLVVWKDGWGDVKSVDRETMRLIVPPESETHGAKVKFAGTIIPRTNALKITAANFGANITRDGNSVNRFVGADGSNGTFPSGANLESWFFDRQQDWLEADVERSNHTQIKNWIVGQKLTPQVSGQVVHYREQQTNEGNLGSRNANHQIGLYEMKLSFGNSDRDETYLHLPIANADVASNQKLVMFLHRKNASNSNPDFIDMEHRDGFMFDLEYSRAISDVAYPRYKWRIAASQNLGASLEALAGDWYVGVAIMTIITIATDVHDLVESWIPKAYTKLYFEGVQLPVEALHISRNSDDDFIFTYRSGQYSQAQRNIFYPANANENTKDIMVSGQQYVINLINADGGTHIRMLANMAQHIKEFDHFKVDIFNSANASLFTETTQKFWQRLARADAGEIVHRGRNAKVPTPHHLNQRTIYATGQGGSFRPYESVSMYNRFDPAPYFRVMLPLTQLTTSTWSATPEMWRDNAPNLAGMLGQWAGSLMRIDIPTLDNSRVLLYVLTDGSTPQDTEMDYLDMRGREWDDITLDPIADFRRDTRRLAHDDANNRSYFCHVLDHATFNAVNMLDGEDSLFYSFILGVWTIASNVLTDRSDVKPRKTLEYVHVR